MRIALVQMEINQGDIHANLARMERFIIKAKRKGAHVIVFPEYSLTGSVRGKTHLIDSKGRYRRIFADLAKKHRIDLVAGSFVERSEGKAYNTSCYFDRRGKLLAAYRKRNLWHSERGRLSSGDGAKAFDTRFGKAGLAICWDLSDPLLFRRMAEAGARIIYVPSFWSDAGLSSHGIESGNIDALCHARAFECECALVYVNAAGIYEPGDTLVGHSQLAVPMGGAIKKLAHNREKILIADLPENSLERAAKVYKIRQDIQSGYLK